MLASGFIEWNFLHYREAMIRSQLGHIRIHKMGYSEFGSSKPFAYLLPDDAPELTALASTPGLVKMAPRLSFGGLVSHGDSTLPFIAEGVDPASETELSESLLIVSGHTLAGDDPSGVILGQGLASNLGVVVGDRLVIIANTAKGGINAADVHVRGLFSSISTAYDDIALRMTIANARQLVRTSGTHTWVLLLDDTQHTQAVLDTLRQRLGNHDYELVPWWNLSDFYNKSERLFAKQVAVMRVIIGLLIILSISNTLTMTVIERTGEIGTSMALGIRRSEILGRFIAEGFVLGILGASLGIVAGYGLAGLLSKIGIPVPAPPGMAHGYIGQILVTPDLAISAALVAAGTTVLASVYPAWKASRMIIVDALRHNRA